MLALLGLELHAQRLFQRGADGGEGGEVAGVLDAGAGVAGVRGEEEGEVAWVVEGRGVKHHALEIFEKRSPRASAVLRGWAAAAQKAASLSARRKDSSGCMAPPGPRLSRRKSR